MFRLDRARILFLAANPDSTTPLPVGRELRRIRERLAVTPRRDAFEIVERWAVRPADLQQALIEVRPDIVHFSGHGNAEYELMLEDDGGSPRPVSKAVLAELFRLRGAGVRLVVLSACHSLPLAEAVAEHVEHAIGMRRAIGSEAAAELSAALYHALGSGDSVRTAFESARLHLEAAGIPEHRTPQLVVRREAAAVVSAAPLSGRAAGQPFVVPFARNLGFVGRGEDLEALHALLQKGGAVGVRPAALTGMGGIGKTQLAVEYAYRYRDAYPGGVYWINAAESWQAELATRAEQVGLREDSAPETDRQRRLALAFARYLEERPGALVVFDNVEDPRSLRRPVGGVIPAQLGCRLLFTSRRRDGAGEFVSVEVSVLPEAAALELLLASEERRGVLEDGEGRDDRDDGGGVDGGAGVGGGEGDELNAARSICRMLGHLPLAVAVAGAYLGQNPEISLADYRDRLTREGALAAVDAAGIDAEDLPTRHPAAVQATLDLSWNTLKEDGPERLLLRAAALLGEAAEIPRARLGLLTGLRDKADKGYAAPLAGALRRLRDLSLVEELTAQAIRLHPLVREFAARQIAEREAFAAECVDRLAETLWDMGRLHEEVAARGIDAVLGDLRAASELAGASGQARLAALLRPMDRESHGLRRWNAAKEPGFFLQQLCNRCFEMGTGEVRERAEAKLEERGWSWLRERIPTSRESEALVRTLEGHADRVTAVAVTADGRFAVSASWDTTLKVWDLATGQVVRTLEGHTSHVSGLAVTSDGRFAVSASWDQTLKVWDLATGQLVRTLEGHTDAVNGVAVTRDSRLAVTASGDRTLKVWDLATGQVVRTLEGHTSYVNSVAVTADGRFAVSASRGKTLRVWDLATGQVIRTLEGHIDQVVGVAVTPDGRFAVSASDKSVRVWDVETGQCVRTLGGHASDVRGVAVTADARFVVSASLDKTLKVWELSTGHAIRTLEGHTDLVLGVAVTADARLVVSASLDKTLKVWDLGMAQAVRTLEGHAHEVSSAAVTADGRLAVSASEVTLKVWDLETGQAVRALEGHAYDVSSVAVTADGRLAISASWDKVLRVWDLATGRVTRILKGHTANVTSVAVAADGRFAVSASGDTTLRVWDLATGQTVYTLEGHILDVTCVAVTADGRFAVSSSWDETLAVWDLSTGQAVRAIEGYTSRVVGVAVTADGRLAVSASNKTLRVWDLATGQAVCAREGHTSPVTGVAVTADGRFAISASWDKTLRAWNLGTGQLIATLETNAPLRCCAVTPDGKTIVAGDQAGALHLLEWRNTPPRGS